MSEREWALVMAYMCGDTKPLLDYIEEEVGSPNLKNCAERAIALAGKNAKCLGVAEPEGMKNVIWYWNDGHNFLIQLWQRPRSAEGFFEARKTVAKPWKMAYMNGVFYDTVKKVAYNFNKD